MKSHLRKKARRKSATPQGAAGELYRLEAEVVEGLEAIAADEIAARFPTAVTLEGQGRGAVRFTYRGDLKALDSLRAVQAVYLTAYHAVPRPKALLGDQNFRVVMTQINTILDLSEQDSFKSLFISAAGSETRVMKRLAETLANTTKLTISDDKGDLWIRIRPAKTDRVGWETLVRLTPRPLATRNWRVCNFEGALNATVAYAIAQLAQSKPEDRILNLVCGSGSLLIEQGLAGAQQLLLGIDYNGETLECARENISAARLDAAIQLLRADAEQLPLPDSSFDILLADLPFGQRVGSHEHNLSLYPRLLAEASRVCVPGGRFIAITHEVRLFEGLLQNNRDWELVESLRITLRGLHPRIYVLRRRST